MRKGLLILIGVFLLVLFMFSGIGLSNNYQQGQVSENQFTSISHTSPHVQIYSSCRDGTRYLYVPLNSSGISVFPLWQIYLYGNGDFKLTVNNTVVESGVVVDSIHIRFSCEDLVLALEN